MTNTNTRRARLSHRTDEVTAADLQVLTALITAGAEHSGLDPEASLERLSRVLQAERRRCIRQAADAVLERSRIHMTEFVATESAVEGTIASELHQTAMDLRSAA